MKRLIFILMTFLMILSCAGCATEQGIAVPSAEDTSVSSAKKQDVVFPDAAKKNNSMSATMRSTVIPTDLHDMQEKASNIVLCTVSNDTESETFESGLTLSYADVSVEQVIKGDVQEQDVLRITETGARLEDKDYSIDGVPLLRKGMHVILFLYDKSEEGRYGIIANYYGKLFLDSDEMVYPSSCFSDRAGIISDFTEPMPLQTLLEKL